MRVKDVKRESSVGFPDAKHVKIRDCMCHERTMTGYTHWGQHRILKMAGKRRQFTCHPHNKYITFLHPFKMSNVRNPYSARIQTIDPVPKTSEVLVCNVIVPPACEICSSTDVCNCQPE
jgi:hypothetical protein